MKILIIPDGHGRDFWTEPCKDISEYDRVIFLGDYTDPYDDEGISRMDTIDNMQRIFHFKRTNKEKVTLLLGNHDLSYIDEDMPKCRYDYANQMQINSLLMADNADIFDILYSKEYRGVKYLFSHSGVLLTWFDNLKKLNKWDLLTDFDIVGFVNNRFHVSEDHACGILAYISRYRGGWDRYSSPVWGDVREFDNYMADKKARHLKDTFQIFAHTRLNGTPIVTNDYACLDCSRAFVLEDGVLKELDGTKLEPIK